MAETTVAEWRQRAERLTAANRAVHETAQHRSESEEGQKRWRDAVDVFWAALGSMYPKDFLQRMAAVGAHGGSVDEAITFLESDVWCFRSGYLKADLLRRLSNVALSPDQRERLRSVLLKTVDVGDRREFKWSCRLARSLGDHAPLAELRQRLASKDAGVRRRAFWMLDRFPIQFSDGERRLVHRIFMDACFDREWWRTQDWVKRAVRKYEDKELQGVALAAFRGSDREASQAALRLLSLFKGCVLDRDELAMLRQRVVLGLESGEFNHLETVAGIPGMHTPDLVEKVAGRLSSQDAEIARRARWVLRWLKEP